MFPVGAFRPETVKLTVRGVRAPGNRGVDQGAGLGCVHRKAAEGVTLVLGVSTDDNTARCVPQPRDAASLLPEPLKLGGRRLAQSFTLALGLLLSSMALSWGSPAIAETRRAGIPLSATHWYALPTTANGCHLNLRSGPATGYQLLIRLSSCENGPWCWYQSPDCAHATVDEVIAGRYSCLDEQRRRVTSNRWTVVALTNSRWAYVASRCGSTRQL